MVNFHVTVVANLKEILEFGLWFSCFLSVDSKYLIIHNLLRNAIRDMVVRGAPAIAIAAALSLAVEVFNLDAFNGSALEAVSYLQNKLEYLVSR